MGKRNRGNRPQLNKAPTIAPAPVADSAVLDAMAKQYNLVAYSPNVPILPYPGMQPQYGPRQWQYPIATNLDLVTRENLTPFEILRRFAQLYDAIALCKQAWFDCAANLEPGIEPAPGLLADGEDASKYAAEMAAYQEFFESPDKQIDIHEWMNAALNDLADIDAVAIYPRLTMAGELYSLDLIDGATVKPLLDERGRTPSPPDYAYEQIVYGAPSGLYTNEQLLYLKEHTRTNSAFGFSRVESVLIRINQALRKQNFDLAKFTDGTVPPGFLSPSADVGWTPDQMIAYQQMFDAALAGNDALRARLRWVPPGTVYTPTSPGGSTTDAMILDLDKFILTMTGASFGVMLPELGFTEQVNKSSGETQEDVTFRRTLRPIAKRFARLFNFILKHFFNERRFIFTWKGYEASEDFNALSAAHVSLVTSGIESIPDANRALKLPYKGPDIPRFIVTTSGPLVVDDLANAQLRKAQVDSQMAGLKLAANPQPQQQESNSDANSQDGEPPDDQKQLARADLRKWRDLAFSRMKACKAQRAFVSTVLPEAFTDSFARTVAACATPEELRLTFAGVQDGHIFARLNAGVDPNLVMNTQIWQESDPDIQKRLAAYRDQGVRLKTWNATPGACDACLANDGQVVPVDAPFASGAYLEPGHDHCGCAVVPVGQAIAEGAKRA